MPTLVLDSVPYWLATIDTRNMKKDDPKRLEILAYQRRAVAALYAWAASQTAIAAPTNGLSLTLRESSSISAASWCRNGLCNIFPLSRACPKYSRFTQSEGEPTVETVEAWLKQHPSVRVVSRDGSTEYASAIRKGAPQAQQVSDRWHLLKNLAACVSVQIAKTLAQLRHVQEPRPAQTQAIQQVQQARHAERMARYEQIMALQKQGMKSGEIAKALSMSQRTLQRWMATGTTPYSRRKSPRPDSLIPTRATC